MEAGLRHPGRRGRRRSRPQLSDGLDLVNEAATLGATPQRELTVSVVDSAVLVGGVSGWTWGTCSGVGMVWVRDDVRHSGLGGRLLVHFEDDAR